MKAAAARAEAKHIELETHEVARGTIPGAAGVVYHVGDRIDLSRGNAESLEKCGIVRRLPLGTPVEEQRKTVLRAERDLPIVEAQLAEQEQRHAAADTRANEVSARLKAIDALVRQREGLVRELGSAKLERSNAAGRIADLTLRRAELKAVLES